ncbi:MAG: DUF4340 domain-containing protein [Gammaproteobacteria bacterium]|nr:DUF4340 domain-containing protein [Gammaproteobacteria bacterium]NIO61642.1 DUF4340 domain-containing protein [Gammaproteobacteria bacterium]NIQ18893.1 DUF4340 domain-containing protein [Gammaproteobacteria bacterium]NIT04942.1 DUF4340 domain-containing protein [Gammaproteobacteria bacterium]NIT40315.1 DUF4340 domain-containing protein [Gammaproteobacteria bacterium]
MKNKNLIILCAVTLTVIIAAAISSNLQSPREDFEKPILFPELANRINDVSKISIQGPGNTVRLQENNGKWFIASSDNYPAAFDKVRQTVLNMSALKLEEKKTDNPNYYAQLGVEDPGSIKASSHLVTLFDATGNTLASVIIGKARQSSGSSPGLYVRKSGDAQSLLVEGIMEVSSDAADWFDRQLFDIPLEEMKEIVIQYADGNTFEIYKETREQSDFKIRDKDDVPSAAKIIVRRIASALEEMRANGVRAANNFEFSTEESIKTIYKTFDGLIIESLLAKIDDRAYGLFSASHDPAQAVMPESDSTDAEELTEKINEYVDTLNDKLSGWVYEIPVFKYEAMTTNIDDLTRFPVN